MSSRPLPTISIPDSPSPPSSPSIIVVPDSPSPPPSPASNFVGLDPSVPTCCSVSGDDSPPPSPSSVVAAPTSTPASGYEIDDDSWPTFRGEYIAGGTGPSDSLLQVQCTCCRARLRVPLAKDAVTCIIRGLGVGLFQNPEVVKVLISIQGSVEEEYPCIDDAKIAFQNALNAGHVQMLS